ncbi:uncharacterized protein LOC113331059 [Papaver somniferum]|uniref:uncharacterized protein LOC113331059 n=1 Tax=Papaver somniferum TaxID=3469 RepID=UPI000E6FAC80|nr:uncharacterized protein LOC113331059 [Papaver somniferum]
MRVLFWNINGVARDAAQDKLKELIREFKPERFCLAEPKVHCSVAFGNILQREGFSPHVIHNASSSSIANVWVCYSNTISPSIVNVNKQAITLEVDRVHVSFVHASYIQVTRRRLWQQLSIHDDSTFCLVIGDFNCILRLDDKRGGLEPRTSAINEFSDWLDDNSLFEADALGTKFTWTNRQSGTDRIISKLDRDVINAAWLAKFENWRSLPKRASIRIQKMWFLHTDFLRMFSESWNMPFHGSLDFIFTYKLKSLKGVIKEWNLAIFGNFHSRLKQDQLRFESAALCSDEDPNDATKLNLMKDVMSRISETRIQHNTMLKQKSRNQWLVEGSSNTTFFHNSIRIRRTSNTISELVDSNGHTISDYDQLRDHVVQFYEEEFNGHESKYDASLFDYEHVGISEEESFSMDRIPTPDEIKQAVFDLVADSAPGPDGFSGCFYRHCWDIIQDDLIKSIIFYWNIDHSTNRVNSSLIILLPKILTTRLGSVLDNLVSEEKVAFMKGRNIHENISLAYEMVNELYIKRKDGNIGLKLDISQAFDTGNLKSLNNLVDLLATFPDRYLGIQIIQGSVRYHHISGVVEMINSQLAGWKGFLLSFHDRLVFVKSVIASYSIHNMAIYKWPRKFILQCERAIRNFIWSGDSNVSRAVVVAYDKVNGLKSSILPVIIRVYKIVESNTKVLLGDGRDTSLYYDAWFSNMSIAAILNDYTLDRNVLVSTILVDGHWNIHVEHLDRMTAAGLEVNLLPTPMVGEDLRIWMLDYKGAFTVSSAKELIRQKYPKFEGASIFWRKEIHPTLATQNWKFLRNACATLKKRASFLSVNSCIIVTTVSEIINRWGGFTITLEDVVVLLNLPFTSNLLRELSAEEIVIDVLQASGHFLKSFEIPFAINMGKDEKLPVGNLFLGSLFPI